MFCRATIWGEHPVTPHALLGWEMEREPDATVTSAEDAAWAAMCARLPPGQDVEVEH